MQQAAYDDLVSIIRWIDERTKRLKIPGDDRSLIAAACFDTVLEHQAATALLVENELYGSAHALLRVLAEGFLRGMWIARCATDEEIQRFRKDMQTKSIRAVAEDIESALGDETDVLSTMIERDWSMLCSFTHTGYLQVTRRYTGEILKPSYTEKEVVQTVNFAGAVGLLAAAELATLGNQRQLLSEIEIRVDQYASQRHGETG